MTTDAVDIEDGLSAAELAGFLGLTSRRVRQIAEDRRLHRVRKGRYDACHAFWELIGYKYLGAERAMRATKYEIAATGWLRSFSADDRPVDRASLATLRKHAIATWGFDAEGFAELLARACGLLGEDAPDFEGAKR